MNGEDLGLCAGFRACACALDSGTSAIAAPSWMARRLALRLAQEQRPVLGLWLQEREFLLELEAPELMAAPWSMSKRCMRDGKRCRWHAFGAQVDVPPPHGPVLLLGDPFLRPREAVSHSVARKYYTAYDRERLQIGFAEVKRCSRTPFLAHSGHMWQR